MAQEISTNLQLVNAPTAWTVSFGSGARLLIIDSGYGLAPGILASDLVFWGACNNLAPPNAACLPNDINAALNWAAGNLGNRGVVNMSFSGPGFSTTTATAVAAVWAANIVLVAAAGNDASNVVHYPAGYSNVLGVSGMNDDLTFADPTPCGRNSRSNWGTHVDLSAPFRAATTFVPNTTALSCGTSLSAPHVAGAAVLMRAFRADWTGPDIVSQLIWSTKDLGPNGYDTKFGKGLLQADVAIGLHPTFPTATIVASKPRLTWNASPLATAAGRRRSPSTQHTSQ
ncbi:MAG: S8 family peptidase [Gemmatimonadaceae bacterium]